MYGENRAQGSPHTQPPIPPSYPASAPKAGEAGREFQAAGSGSATFLLAVHVTPPFLLHQSGSHPPRCASGLSFQLANFNFKVRQEGLAAPLTPTSSRGASSAPHVRCSLTDLEPASPRPPTPRLPCPPAFRPALPVPLPPLRFEKSSLTALFETLQWCHNHSVAVEQTPQWGPPESAPASDPEVHRSQSERRQAAEDKATDLRQPGPSSEPDLKPEGLLLVTAPVLTADLPEH